jgi:hypothetical protein
MWQQNVGYSNGGMTVHAGDLEVNLSQLYVLAQWQYKSIGYRLEDAFAEFRVMTGL